MELTARNWSVWLLFFVFCFLFSASSASAQTPDTGLATPNEAGLRLVTSPLPISLVTEPGKTVSTDLKVKNAGLVEERLKIDIYKFKVLNESGAPHILDPEPGDDFLRWVTFSEPTFTLPPEEWKTITATFAVPETASFGYYYAFVFSRVAEPREANERETQVIGGTATLVLLEARIPDAKRAVSVLEFSTDRNVYEFLPVTFTVKLRNAGNVHVAPRGNIFIERGKDKNVALLELNPEKGNILPESNRLFEEAWTDGFPVYEPVMENGAIKHDENGNMEQTLTWNWENTSKLRYGKYTGKMLLVYDDGTRDIPIEGVVTFWVVPWRVAIAGVAIPTVPAFLVYYFMKRRMRKKLDEMLAQANKE